MFFLPTEARCVCRQAAGYRLPKTHPLSDSPDPSKIQPMVSNCSVCVPPKDTPATKVGRCNSYLSRSFTFLGLTPTQSGVSSNRSPLTHFSPVVIWLGSSTWMLPCMPTDSRLIERDHSAVCMHTRMAPRGELQRILRKHFHPEYLVLLRKQKQMG